MPIPGWGGGKSTLFFKAGASRFNFILLFVFFCLNADAQQTLCQEYGGIPIDITIGMSNPNGQLIVTFLSTLYPNGANLQNIKIRVNGILKVDRSLTLNNCTIELGPGSQIATDGPNTISSTNCRYYSCSRMWKGFLVKSAGTLLLLWGEIEDAEAAITMDDGAAASISGVMFDRNHIGIRNGSATVGPTAINFIFFGGNTFDCSSPLSPAQSSLNPAWTGTGFAGVYLNYVVGSFNSVLGGTGFQRMHFGFYLENSDVTISACWFQDMIKHPTILNSVNGIRSIGGALGVNYCYFNRFSSIGHGIWAEGSELNIINNNFTVFGRSAITSTKNVQADYLYIKDNTIAVTNSTPISGARVGISVDRNSVGNTGLTSFDVSGNIIDINGYFNNGNIQRGILITGTVPSLDIGLVSHNIITANTTVVYVQNGIEIMAGFPDRFRALDNNVTYNDHVNLDNGKRWGISMLYGTGINHRLQGNTCIANGGSNGQGYCGIHLEDMPNVTMCNNSVDNFEHGIHFFGGCPGLGFWDNTMNRHLRAAVRLQNNSNLLSNTPGFIGTHTRTGNRWPVLSTAMNNSSWNGQPFNRLIVPANLAPFSPTTFIPASFGTVAAGNETICQQPPTFGDEGGGILTDFDQWVKDGTSGFPTLSAWEARRQFMYKLMRFPELLLSDSTVNNFYQTQINTTSGKFAQVDFRYLQTVLQITNAENASSNLLAVQRNTLIEGLNSLGQTNGAVTPATTPSNSQIMAKKAMLDSWKTNLVSRNALKQEVFTHRLAKIQEAQQLLASIATSSVHESNWKIIEGIRLARYTGLGEDETSLDMLRAIAIQCPEIAGGSAVAALYMLPEVEIGLLRPDEQTGLAINCLAEPRGSNKEIKSRTGLLKLSPNPANDRFSIEFLGEESGVWEIISPQGKKVLHGRVSKTQALSVETTLLSEGVFIFVFTSSLGTRASEKFIVIK